MRSTPVRTLIFSPLITPASGYAQAPAQTAAKPIPRTADGKPDFTGAWQGGGVSLYGESVGNTRATAAVPQAPAAGRGGGGGRGAADRLVYKDEAEAKVQAGRGTTWKDDPT